MKSTVHTVFLGLCIAAAFLLAFSYPVRAQGVVAGAVDVAGSVGYSNLTGIDNNKHINYGGSVGYNLSRDLTILGEFSYFQAGSVPASDLLPGATGTVKGNYQQYGGAVRQAIVRSKTVVPYLTASYGYARLTTYALVEPYYDDFTGVTSATNNGDYFGFGGGASIYLGKGFGLRPEFLFEPLKLPIPGMLIGQNLAVITGSVFYQFGGKRGTKKAAAPKN